MIIIKTTKFADANEKNIVAMYGDNYTIEYRYGNIDVRLLEVGCMVIAKESPREGYYLLTPKKESNV